RLDAAIPPVAHPAGEPMIERGIFREGAVTHALHAPADDDVADHASAHPTSPVSLARALHHRARAPRATHPPPPSPTHHPHPTARPWRPDRGAPALRRRDIKPAPPAPPRPPPPDSGGRTKGREPALCKALRGAGPRAPNRHSTPWTRSPGRGAIEPKPSGLMT